MSTTDPATVIPATAGAAVGVIGLGKMGLPMARHLLEAGYRVVGFDPDDGRAATADGDGIVTVATPAAVAEQCDAVLIVVGFDHQVREVCFGTSGLAQADGTDRCVLISSTIEPETSREVATELGKRGWAVADATLCRAEHAAVDGTLLVLFGGPTEVLERWRGALSCFASDIAHVGEVGTGQIAKMINNVLLWITVIGNQEALRLAKRLGMDQQRLIDGLLLSSGANWAMSTWAKARPMPWAEDDLAICLDLAATDRFSMPLTAAVREIMKDVKRIKHSRVPGGPEASMQEFVEVVDDF